MQRTPRTPAAPGDAYGDEFDFGLDLILEGLDRALRAAGADDAGPPAVGL